jgi:hypothetical protein
MLLQKTFALEPVAAQATPFGNRLFLSIEKSIDRATARDAVNVNAAVTSSRISHFRELFMSKRSVFEQ